MKKTILTLVAATSSLMAYADNPPPSNTDTNAAVLPAPPVKYPWESSVSAGLTLTRGNTDTTLFNADFLTQRKTPDNEYQFGADAVYGSQASKETVNNYKAFGQWNRLFTDRFYAYMRVEAMRDIIANLDYRATVGPGVGYYLLKDTNTTLAVEAGGAWVVQHLPGQDDSYMSVRFAEHGEHKFNDHVHLWEKAEIMPQVDKPDNYVVNAEIGLEAALTKSLSTKTYLDDTYANRPATGKLKNDSKIFAALFVQVLASPTDASGCRPGWGGPNKDCLAQASVAIFPRNLEA